MKNIFLDTNVVIDYLSDRCSFSNASTELFDLYANNNQKVYIAAVSYTNIYYILNKQYKSHKKVINMLSQLLELSEIVDTTKNVVKDAIKSAFLDFEDAVQYSSALSNTKIDIIVSRDKKGFNKSSIPVMDVEQALVYIKLNNK